MKYSTRTFNFYFFHNNKLMAEGSGFKPELMGPKPTVLPLDYPSKFVS